MVRGVARAVVIVAALSLAAASAGKQKGPSLGPRAAFDLSCPESDLSYTQINDDTWGVRGCGRQATYIRVCDRPNVYAKCTWVLNDRAERR